MPQDPITLIPHVYILLTKNRIVLIDKLTKMSLNHRLRCTTQVYDTQQTFSIGS